MWVVSTSALLLGVPYALSIAEEQQVVEMEKEQKMREMGNEVSFSIFVLFDHLRREWDHFDIGSGRRCISIWMANVCVCVCFSPAFDAGSGTAATARKAGAIGEVDGGSGNV